jgi:hypothetical protein
VVRLIAFGLMLLAPLITFGYFLVKWLYFSNSLYPDGEPETRKADQPIRAKDLPSSEELLPQSQHTPARNEHEPRRRSMAWFDPPLYKPGNHKCPNCGQPQGWNCYFQSRRWGPLGSWHCSKCQSALVLDVWRYLLGFLGPVIAALTFLVFALTMPVWPSWLVFVVVLALVVFGGFNYWWSMSVRLKRTPKQPQSV